MAKVLEPITACLKKGETKDDKDETTMNSSTSNEKSPVKDVTQPSLLWRVSSQAYNIGSGVVGLGVGSVKWTASTALNVGSGVVSATQTVVSKVMPSTVPKPKKE